MSQEGERLAPSKTAAQTAGPAMASFADEIDLRAMFRTFWRRKYLLLGTITTITLITLVLVLQLAKLYSAEALVAIESQKKQIVQIEEVMPALAADLATIETQIEILRSRALAGKVIKRLKLTEDAEFNPDLRKEKPGILSIINPLGYLPPDWAAWLGYDADQGVPSEMPAAERSRELVTDAFLKKLSVRPRGRSYVISIEFDSEVPEKAALIANTISDLYLVDQLEAKFEATRRAAAWLSERLVGLRQKLLDAESAVETYRAKAGLVQSKGITVISQQRSELNTALIKARADRAGTESRLTQVERLVKTPNGIESLPEVLGSSLIVKLREQEIVLLRDEAALATRYGDRHPKMINVHAALEDLRAKIQSEIDKIVKSLANAVDIARAREGSLRKSLDELRDEAARVNSSEVRLRELQRDADANKALYEAFLSRFKETTEQQGLQQPDVRVISRAAIPTEPSFPKPAQFVGLAFVGSVLIGVLLIVVLERLDSGFRSAEQVERLSGVPALGLVPTVRTFAKAGKSSGTFALETAGIPFSEAIRTLRTALILSNVDRPPKVILITSSIPQEGKTVLAASLARHAAQFGQRCLLIDCDLRRSQLPRVLGLPDHPGLVDVLLGEKPIEEVIQTDGETGLHFVPVGEDAPSPADLLGSQRMKDLLVPVAPRYDLVVLEAPPVMVVSDARVLARLVDKTVLAVRWERTPREVALAGLKQMLDAGADVAGIVLTRVNARKHARYDYTDSGLYSARYAEYYTR